MATGKIRRFDELNIYTRTGNVVGNQGRTAVQGSATTTTRGGGAYYGTSTDTTVTTTSTHHQRLFVQQDDGHEFDVEFADMGLGVREGHRLTVVFAGDKRSGHGYAMAVANHTSNRHEMFPKRVNWILSSWIKPLILGGGALLVLLLIFTRGGLGGISMPLLLIVGGVLAWEIYRWLTLYRKVRLEVEETARAALRTH